MARVEPNVLYNCHLSLDLPLLANQFLGVLGVFFHNQNLTLLFLKEKKKRKGEGKREEEEEEEEINFF